MARKRMTRSRGVAAILVATLFAAVLVMVLLTFWPLRDGVREGTDCMSTVPGCPCHPYELHLNQRLRTTGLPQDVRTKVRRCVSSKVSIAATTPSAGLDVSGC